MNLLLFESNERQGDTVILTGKRAEHIRNILRSSIGNTLRVGEINGAVGTATITEMTDSSVILKVACNENPPPVPNVELILALPRPIMLQRILKQATVLGVRRFHLIRSRRVEKSFFHSPVLRPEKIRCLLLDGLSQAMDTRLPEVIVYHRFKPFVEDIVPTLKGCGLLAHPEATHSLADMFMFNRTSGKGKENEKILLAIGPEGGFREYECRQFVQQGFTMFTMGQRILHVDTAVVALLAQLSFLSDNFRMVEPRTGL